MCLIPAFISIFIFLSICAYRRYKRIKSKPPTQNFNSPKFLLLSMPGSNATTILHSFGQIPNSLIRNELAYLKQHQNSLFDKIKSKFINPSSQSKNGKYWLHQPDPTHQIQIDQMINLASTSKGPSFFHETVSNLTLTEIEQLKKAGFTLILLFKNPHTNCHTLQKLIPDPDDRKTILMYGWNNLHRYQYLTDLIIIVDRFLTNSQYRVTCFETLNLSLPSSIQEDKLQIDSSDSAEQNHKLSEWETNLIHIAHKGFQYNYKKFANITYDEWSLQNK